MPGYDAVMVAGLLTSFLVAVVATRLVLGYAQRRLVDPVNERSSHTVPTPRGGGLGLVVGLLCGGLVCAFGLASDPAGLASFAVMGGVILIMAAIGWWDDHAGLRASHRLVAQAILVALVLWRLGIPADVRVGPWVAMPPDWLIGSLLLVGMLWIVNLTNFMDGIDGIAGSQGVAVGVGAVLSLSGCGAGDPWCGLGYVLAGSSAGFLVWNFPPARIFMGDVGSTSLGLVFAVLILAQIRVGIALDLALLPLFPFAADATCTLARRAWRREPLSQAHRTHLYQRLARRWGSHLPVTLLWAGLAVVGVIGAAATRAGVIPPLSAFLLMCLLFTALVLVGRRISPV